MMAPMLRALGFLLALGLGVPTDAQARIELTRAGVESAAAPGNWCIGADAHKLAPGLSAGQVAIAGRSTGARVRALIVISQGGDRFRLTAGRAAIATFSKSGNSPTQFWLAARPGTAPGVHAVRFRAFAEDGTRSNEVSCLVDTHPAGLFPPELHPYALEVLPDSFVSRPGGVVPSGPVDPRARTGAPFATPETQVKLEARRKPGHAEPPPAQRRCTFEAVDAQGGRQLHEANSCEGVVIRLPAGDYRLRLGFRYAEANSLAPAFVERGDYRVLRTSGTIVNPCVEPCTLRGNLCVRPSSGGGVAFACTSDSNCASEYACIDGACLARCRDGSACPESCELRDDGKCLRPLGWFRVACAMDADCRTGDECVAGECRQPCLD